MTDKKRKVDFSGDLRGNGLIDPATTVTYTEVKPNGDKNVITDYGVKNNNAAPQPVPKPPKNNSFSKDNIGVRQFANAVGFDNNKIGWSGGNTVTYDGEYFLTADKNDNGVTKSGVNSLIGAINDYYKRTNKSNSINDVTKAVSGLGLSNAVDYGDGGVVTIGGIPLKNAVVVDGQAYAPMQNILEVVNSYKEKSGFSQPLDTFKAYSDKNSAKVKDLSEKIRNYADFEYDPEADPAYKAYKEIFLKNARLAADDAWGRNAARSGGYANSAAMAASDIAYYDELSKLNEVVPHLMEAAYGRYRDNYEDLFKELELYGTPKDLFDMEYDAQSEQNKMIQEALKSDYERDTDVKEYNRDVFADDRDYEHDVFTDERDFERDVYEYDNDFARNVFEHDRDFDREVFEDERDFARDVYEDERDYKRGVYEFDKKNGIR